MVKRRAELLVEKRGGQVQWLRATKLARSILLALQAEGEPDEWRALDLAATVLAGLRVRKGRRRRNLTTDEVAAAVTEVLLATGFPGAAQAYVDVAAERARRARTLAGTGAAASGADELAPGMAGHLAPDLARGSDAPPRPAVDPLRSPAALDRGPGGDGWSSPDTLRN